MLGPVCAAVEMATLRASALGKKAKKNFFGFGEAADVDSSSSSLDKSKIGF